MDNDCFFVSTDNDPSLISIQPCSSIIFGTPEVGRICWEDGVLRFEGNIDESAKIFFEYFWKNYVETKEM